MKTATANIMASVVLAAAFSAVFPAGVAKAQNEPPAMPTGDSIDKSLEETKGAFKRLISVTDRISVNPLNWLFADKIAAAVPRSTDEVVELAKKIGEAGKSAARPLDSFVNAYTFPVLDLLLKAAVFVFDKLGDIFRYVFRI